MILCRIKINSYNMLNKKGVQVYWRRLIKWWKCLLFRKKSLEIGVREHS